MGDLCFADAVFGGEGAVPGYDAGGQGVEDGAGAGEFGGVAGDDVEMEVVVADVAEEDVAEAGAGKGVAVEGEEGGERKRSKSMKRPKTRKRMAEAAWMYFGGHQRWINSPKHTATRVEAQRARHPARATSQRSWRADCARTVSWVLSPSSARKTRKKVAKKIFTVNQGLAARADVFTG